VRGRFAKAAKFRKFLAAKDYSHNLADVTDGEFEETADRLERSIRRLAAKQRIDTGSQLYLPSVWQVRCLSWAPLFDNRWLDCYVVRLAEFGAELAHRGYRRVPSDDWHPLAAPRYFPPDADWHAPQFADSSEIQAARLIAEQNLDRFPGRRMQIAGRDFIDATEYAAWASSRLKCKTARTEGIVIASWNDSTDALSTARSVNLSGVAVGKIDDPAMSKDRDYIVCSSAQQLQSELAIRCLALRTMFAASKSQRGTPVKTMFNSNLGFIPNDLQRRMLCALKNRSLRNKVLAREAKCAPRSLYRLGGVKGLINAGLVNHHKSVGYYRPDAPPPDIEKYLAPKCH
jgi:hypothetical protein